MTEETANDESVEDNSSTTTGDDSEEIGMAGGSMSDAEMEESSQEDTNENTTSEERIRTNPLLLGESKEIDVVEYDEGNEITGTANITIGNVLRGQDAMDALTDEYSSPQQPDDENYEWVVFELTYELL